MDRFYFICFFPTWKETTLQRNRMPSLQYNDPTTTDCEAEPATSTHHIYTSTFQTGSWKSSPLGRNSAAATPSELPRCPLQIMEADIQLHCITQLHPADDTAVVGLISNTDETADRDISLIVGKTREVIIFTSLITFWAFTTLYFAT